MDNIQPRPNRSSRRVVLSSPASVDYSLLLPEQEPQPIESMVGNDRATIDEADPVSSPESSFQALVHSEPWKDEMKSEMQKREIEAPGDVTQQNLHDRYVQFLRVLCVKTDTADVEDFCLGIYPHMVHKGRIMAFDESYEGTILDISAQAFVIFVWLFVCSRSYHRQSPERGEYLHKRWGTYFLSAVEISLTQGFFSVNLNGQRRQDDDALRSLEYALQCWENRYGDMADNRSWAAEGWLQSLDHLEDDGHVRYRNHDAAEYLDAMHRGGIPDLVRLLLRQEEETPQTPLKDWPEDKEMSDKLFQGLILILVSMDEDLLQAVITGQVAKRAQNPTSRLRSVLREMEKSREAQPPSIYINSLCDEAGLSPTISQWRSICDLMDLYIQDSDAGDRLAIDVDQTVHPTPNWPIPNTRRLKKLRRYAEFVWLTRDERDLINTSRRKNISEFIASMRIRLAEESQFGGENVPLKAPVVEVGFSDRVYERLRQHRHHESSNYIMNLADALFQHRYPGWFRLHQHIIYHCWRETQPWYSEILLSRLAQSYTQNAAGFNHYGAGGSNGSSYAKRSAEDWERFQREVCGDGRGFMQRLERVQAKSEEARVAAEERQREIEAEKLEAEYIKAFTELIEAATQVVEHDMSACGSLSERDRID
ncbi:MAG: hypothetical protein Q9207_003667 [Kuettlingeria erythrocarpa]